MKARNHHTVIAVTAALCATTFALAWGETFASASSKVNLASACSGDSDCYGGVCDDGLRAGGSIAPNKAEQQRAVWAQELIEGSQ